MIQVIKNSPPMTIQEAAAKYPYSYIRVKIIRDEGWCLPLEHAVVLEVSDNEGELRALPDMTTAAERFTIIDGDCIPRVYPSLSILIVENTSVNQIPVYEKRTFSTRVIKLKGGL